MNSVPSFVSELVRVANATDHLANRDIANLLMRAVIAIRDLRGIIGIPVDGTEHDAIIRLKDLASAAGQTTPDEVRNGLLEAADMIRTLWIVVDSGTQIVLTPVP